MILRSGRVSTFPSSVVRPFYQDKKDSVVEGTVEESNGVKVRKNTERTKRMTTRA